MQPVDDLHTLAHSMTKAEKRQFKLLAGEGSNYARLFDAILAQAEYDEAALKAAFEGDAFTKNFSVAKAYLYESLLHSLRSFRTPASPDIALRRALDDIELLFAKGLRAQAGKVLQKGLRQARLQDHPAHEAELLKWRRRLVNLQAGKDWGPDLAAVEAEEADALRRLTEEATLRSIHTQVQAVILKQIDQRRPENAGLMERLMAHPLLTSPPDGLAFHARQAYHQIHASHHRMVGDTLATLVHYAAAVTEWGNHPAIRDTAPEQYINALARFLDACIRAHEFSGFAEILSTLNRLPLRDARLSAQAFYLSHHLELRYAITTGQLETGIRRAHEFEEGLQLHGKFLQPGMVLTTLYNLMIVHFLGLDFHGAVRYINRILNQPLPEVRQDIFDATRLIELAAHYELANYDLLESLLRAMDRRLRLQPRAHAFEKLVIQGLRRVLDTPGEGRMAVFRNIAEAFEGMEGALYLIGREEVLIWLRAKIEGKRPAELMGKN